jgi:hypothetical protein
MQFIAFDDLNSDLQALLYVVSEGLPGVSAVDQHAFNSLQIRPTAVDSLQGAANDQFLPPRSGDGMGRPCVSTAMGRLMLDTFLPALYPLCSALSVFFTLCASTIKNLVMALRPCFAAGLASLIFKARSRNADSVLTEFTPLGKIRMHRAPFGKSLGKPAYIRLDAPSPSPLKDREQALRNLVQRQSR